jgi:hypothetical protein
MKKLILNLFLLISILFASSSSYALDFIKFGTSHDADFWNDPTELAGVPSTVQYLQQRGKNQTTSIDLTDQNVQDVFNGDFGAFEAIVVSETIIQLSPESYALFNQYVSDGGCFILTGSHQAEDDFLNNAFGFNVAVVSVNSGVDTFSIQPGASGTLFAGGPSGLIAANATVAFSNTPGIDVYNGTTGEAVFTDTFGEGTLTAIGWDYCCTPPDNPSDIIAWYEVINRAFDQCTGEATSFARPIPTLSEWGLIGMAGILGMIGLFAAMRRRKVTA